MKSKMRDFFISGYNHSVTVIVVGNGISDLNSKPGQGYLCFTSL